MSLLQDLGAFSNPFGAPAQGEWNLLRGVYTTLDTNQQIVLFFEKPDADETPTNRTALDTTSDTGGRRLAIYEYAYLDGQRVKDLGRKGMTYTFNLKFFGLNYQDRFQEFIRVVVNTNEQAILNHPTLSPVIGSMVVRFRDFEFVHKFDEWNAITIKAVFVEDNTGALDLVNLPAASADSALRTALQTIIKTQATISANISAVGAILQLPNAILTAMQTRLMSLSGDVSRLMGQLGSTFSSSATVQGIAAQAAPLVGGITDVSAGTVVATPSGQTQTAQLPPVYQVGFDATTQAALDAQISNFVDANQITPSQAVFAANQNRAAITAAITEVNTNFGNYGYDTVLQYRELATQVQSAVEAAIATAQSLVKIYTTPSPMSLRQVAFATGLDPDRQNDIEALNPYLPSVNYVPAGFKITVPAA